MKKVVTEGESGVGVAVQMQYRGEIWKGQILSLHGKTALCILWVFLFLCVENCIVISVCWPTSRYLVF